MCVNKYEARMKATFYFERKIVKTLTLIDVVEAEDMMKALEKTDVLLANLRGKLFSHAENNRELQEIIAYLDVDDIEVELSAIVPASNLP